MGGMRRANMNGKCICRSIVVLNHVCRRMKMCEYGSSTTPHGHRYQPSIVSVWYRLSSKSHTSLMFCSRRHTNSISTPRKSKSEERLGKFSFRFDCDALAVTILHNSFEYDFRVCVLCGVVCAKLWIQSSDWFQQIVRETSFWLWSNVATFDAKPKTFVQWNIEIDKLISPLQTIVQRSIRSFFLTEKWKAEQSPWSVCCVFMLNFSPI